MSYESGWPLVFPDGRSADVAFELTARSALLAEKWQQPPDPNWPGLTAHDWQDAAGGDHGIVLADQWQCQGGDVADVYWYGNYQLDGGGNEIRGSGISNFRLGIHANIPGDPWCLPGDELWSALVPFGMITEQDTGEVNIEGSPIYRYEFLLTPPFAQTEGIIHWLDVTAYADNPVDPPMWRWQEARRAVPPILCSGAWTTYPEVSPWQSINWPNLTYSDLAFDVTSVFFGEPYIKWSQPPEPYTPADAFNGWDQLSRYGQGSPPPYQLTADDWVCQSTDPVTDIHWWGSFLGWYHQTLPTVMPEAFHIGIWTDVPADPDDPAGFSHPGTMIWEKQCYMYAPQFVGWDFDPRVVAGGLPPTPEATFRFDCNLNPEEWFWQDPGQHIYWLSIAAIYGDGQVDYPWGWKTRPRNPDSPAPDDAVVVQVPTAPVIGDSFVSGSPIEYPAGFSWDLAFVLTTQPQQTVDLVVCEPQPPSHPPRYWYQITPDYQTGRCDFHVRVFDPNPASYTNVVMPPNWVFAVHQVAAAEWWASWWSPGCADPMSVSFVCGFDNPNGNVWGDWTTTTDGSADPHARIVDQSGNHAGEPNGSGYLVHVPVRVVQPKWLQEPQGAFQGFDAASDLWWMQPEQSLLWEQRPNPSLPGLYAHDWTDSKAYGSVKLADDWPDQQPRPVTDLHWWGNYELDDAGQEMRGEGIDHFHLSIHYCGGGSPWCLPVQNEAWGLNVPFATLIEENTGLVNIEGSKIYRYRFNLPVPFRKQSSYFWFDAIAVASNPFSPPMWRWQEARRDVAPPLSHAPAASSTDSGPWQSIVWLANPERYSDLAFQVTALPASAPDPLPNRVLADDFISDGRPVEAIRWWGSYLDDLYTPEHLPVEPYVLDGWFISFHHADLVSDPACPPDLLAGDPHPTVLGVYFAPVAAVSIQPIDMVDCVGHALYRYDVDLSNCCLICSQLDPRPAVWPPDPARPGVFLESAALKYWLNIQAVVGLSWLPGQCTYEERVLTGHLPSPNDPDGHFWGWHTSPGPVAPCLPMEEACVGKIVSFQPYPGECWDYGEWAKQPWLCDTMPPFPPVNMAFALMTSAPEPCPTCPGDLNGDGVVNGLDIQGFVECILSGSSGTDVVCPCGDFNCSNTAELGDINAFVGELLNTTVCSGTSGPYLGG